MAKKKRKKIADYSFKPSSTMPKKSTSLELAFKKAEAQKNNDSSVKKVTQPINAELYLTGKKNLSVTDRPLLKPKPRKSTSDSSKEKHKLKPLPAAQKIKTTVSRNQPTKKKKTLPKAVPSASRKKPTIKLGLKPERDQAMVLNVVDSQGVSKRHPSVKSNPIVSVASKSQVHNGNSTDESDIVIGFDFGTSSSKVVIQDSGLQTAYAIPFGFLACSDNIYLIPTRIFINEDGQLNLSRGEHLYSNLKIHLIDKPEQTVFTAMNTSQKLTASELTAAYIAQVICFARAWFLKEKESIYRNTHIHWHINLGIPSKNYDNQKMRMTFQTIATAAWRISLMDSKITITEVSKYLQEAEIHIATEGKDFDSEDYDSLWLHPDYVNTHPEVIMEIIGYVRSPLRTGGLHLIVDVGASTLDTATFIIHKEEGEDVFPLLDTSVERLGILMLHIRRVQAAKASLEKSLSELSNIDTTGPLPDHSHYGIELSKEDILKNDDSFFAECRQIIGSAVQNTKDQRDPNSSIWDTELPVFICGGGSRHSLYRTMIDELGQSFAKAWNDFRGFMIREMPKPEKLDAPDLSHHDYDRLAVAYGLSFTSDEIGKVIPKSKVSDIEKRQPKSDIENRYISKDMC